MDFHTPDVCIRNGSVVLDMIGASEMKTAQAHRGNKLSPTSLSLRTIYINSCVRPKSRWDRDNDHFPRQARRTRGGKETRCSKRCGRSFGQAIIDCEISQVSRFVYSRERGLRAVKSRIVLISQFILLFDVRKGSRCRLCRDGTCASRKVVYSHCPPSALCLL